MSDNFAEYLYPTVGGAYRYNLIQKCAIVIGRPPSALMDTGDHTIIRFDPPLSDEDKVLLDSLLVDPPTACDAPKAPPGSSFIIPDLFDSGFKENLSEMLGCEVYVWFSKSTPDAPRPDLVELQFSKELSAQDKQLVVDEIKSMDMGWK